MTTSLSLPAVPAPAPRRRLGTGWCWIAGFHAMLLLSGAVLLGLVDRLDSQHERVRRSAAIEQGLGQLLQVTVDAETGTRGFLLTGDRAFLEPANGVIGKLEGKAAAMREMLAGHPEQLSDLDQLRQLMLRRVRLTQPLVDVSRPLAAPQRAALAVRDGKRLQDEIRALVARMLARERALLDQSVGRSELATRALQVFVILSMAVLALLSWRWLQARKRLRHSQGDYAHLFATAANGMALVAADGHIIQANASYCAMLGYELGQLDGQRFDSLKHPDERGHAVQVFASLMSGACQTVRNERRYLDRHGGAKWIRSTLSRTPAARGAEARILVVAEDVSERVRDEEMLRRSAALLGNASRMAGIDGWSMTLPCGALQLGPHALTVLGLEAAAPAALLARLAPASCRALLRAVASCRRHGTPFDLELDWRRVDGELAGMRVMGAAVYGRLDVKGIEGAMQDVTETRRYRQVLAESEQRFRAAALVTSDGIWDWQVGSGHVWRSRSIAALIGMDAAALAPDNDAWRRLMHPDDGAVVDAALAHALAGPDDGVALEYRVLRADGSYAHVADQARILRDGAGSAVRLIGGVCDLTGRKRTQQAIMQMAASVPSSNPDAFFTALLRNLLQALGADGGGVARNDPDQPGRGRLMAAMVDGAPTSPTSPTWPTSQAMHAADAACCALLPALPELALPGGLAEVWPGSMAWTGAAARYYAGTMLVAADGSELGFIFALFRNPVEQVDVTAPVLQVFAARASAEIERGDAALRMREQADLLEHAQGAIVVLGLDLRIRYANRGAGRMYGWDSDAARERSVLDCYAEPELARSALKQVLDTGQWEGESFQRRRDGSSLTVEERWTLVRNDAGAPASILKIGSDVSERNAAQEEIRRLAYYDSLTGLPNRRLLLDRLDQLRLRCTRHGRSGALLFIDMDNFKTLNDQHGHEMGDEFLRCAAARLRDCVRSDDTVARLGGDEFVVLLDNLDAAPGRAALQARAVGASIVEAFRQPVELGSHTHRSTTSIGIVLVHDAEVGVRELLSQADAAMYQAKSTRNTVCVAAAADEPAFLEPAELAGAAGRGELALWLLPQAGADGQVSGALAELRWQHPGRGLLPPGEFMPLAERCGLLAEMTDWLLAQACRCLAQWQDDPARAHLEIALALTAQQVRDPGFAERIVQAVAESGARAQRLTLVVPGSALDLDALPEQLARLRASGLRIALAQTGGAAGSLERLRQIEVDELQLDPALVAGVALGRVDQALVTLVLGLGRALEMRVVATGLEHAEQALALSGLGCLAFQGPLFGPAAPAEQFSPESRRSA